MLYDLEQSETSSPVIQSQFFPFHEPTQEQL